MIEAGVGLGSEPVVVSIITEDGDILIIEEETEGLLELINVERP